ncbi:RAB6-interacting golgin-like [Physella acuta]|uniref:RAB6-interacting golgin-like n=1 Tax=Physella acuta TaxID=109671 RepID=UPI0027DAEFD7|nr:RAB6-interacting golgin-like [Physella acuta]
MAGWTGFSDEDLRRMRQTSNKISDEKVPRAKVNQRPRPNQSPRAREGIKQNTTDTQSGHSVKVAAPDKVVSPDTPPSHQNNNVEKTGVSGTDVSGTAGTPDTTSPAGSETPAIRELDISQARSMELENVHKFQQHQKVIEEANKHKRALLAKAIEDRRKKAKAEAEKLMRVQQELNHLDHLLTGDVSIIRDKIEVASLEYNDAQKRYEKAEKEFVAAKMDLFSKGEVKERLTEHLYTIIHQNEVRKARKLVELMEKLAMEVTPEEMELTIPAIPQLTNFTAVATLHDPMARGHSQLEETVGTSVGNKTAETAANKTAETAGNETADMTMTNKPADVTANITPSSGVSTSSQSVTTDVTQPQADVTHPQPDVTQPQADVSHQSTPPTNSITTEQPTSNNIEHVQSSHVLTNQVTSSNNNLVHSEASDKMVGVNPTTGHDIPENLLTPENSDPAEVVEVSHMTLPGPKPSTAWSNPFT